MIDLPILKTELATDPNAYGYGNSDATDEADAALLNEVRSAIQVNRAAIPTNEIREAIVGTEWAGLSAVKQRSMIFLTAGESVNPNAGNVRATFLSAFGGGTATRANLAAIEQRDGSRAEDLFASGDRVTPSIVANARRS